MGHDKVGHDPLNPLCVRNFQKSNIGKQAVVLAVRVEQEPGEDCFPAAQTCCKKTTSTATTLLKVDSKLGKGNRKIKANSNSF